MSSEGAPLSRTIKSRFVAYCDHCEEFIGVRTYNFRQWSMVPRTTQYSQGSTTKFTPHKDPAGRPCPKSGIAVDPVEVMAR